MKKSIYIVVILYPSFIYNAMVNTTNHKYMAIRKEKEDGITKLNNNQKPKCSKTELLPYGGAISRRLKYLTYSCYY